MRLPYLMSGFLEDALHFLILCSFANYPTVCFGDIKMFLDAGSARG